MDDWGGLRAILDEAVEDRQQDLAEGPVACPNDGEPLIEHNGYRYCPSGDYRWFGF